MTSAIIVDDELLSRDILRKLLGQYCPSVEIIAECKNADEASASIRQLKPGLVFLDVAMPGKSGIELLKELGEINFQVIFVTAHDRFVLQALRLSAADYLSKPVAEDELIAAVEHAQKRMNEGPARQHIDAFLQNMLSANRQEGMQLCVPDIRGFQIIYVKDILYCEADNNYTIIWLLDNKKIIASRSLLDYETLLQDNSFLRIHKSYLINLKHLKSYIKGEGGIAVMSNGTQLEVSRRKKETFLSKMKEVFKY